MDDYFNAFYNIVKETQESSGYVLPEDIESYIVMLLSHHIDKPNWMPEDSFAQVYLSLSAIIFRILVILAFNYL